VNPSSSEPVKITPIPGDSRGIHCNRDEGPTFGNFRTWDLLIWSKDSSGSFKNHLDLGFGFTCPPNADKTTYFTGEKPFEIDEMEVFKVDF